MTFDELRQAFPHLGFAVYAMTPGAPVTLEVYDGGRVFSFSAASAQEAIDEAFPVEEPETAEPVPNAFE
ncbi:hypothetical protein [Ochrobactrum sp. A-1]|uniref:hypothetical protein n=1 Tax=Ochrobactrum sp. A-1 TaxID=2920940 RepID=UPI001F0ABB10|nr:hypothetical protein [Ochrobactrum sp. A-1]